ncbi:retropepsin-like aspartic protease [Chondromyces crocatus]|uniref:Uncharacterized protein n=1 Tax=Chondromyces crocatus TaxID=52 RepID=A0A0K1ECE6_CHOCO|nr:retropepsin-like aspartic protease [Chondromyces crocatus]AKT38357.1 uncharacterized protein CMC5_025030 [Chondromyces crocatus]
MAKKRPTCHAHPEAPATASCARCYVPLCTVCRVQEAMDSYCARCMKSRRRAPYVRAALTLLGLGVAGLVTFFVYRSYEAPYDHGKHTNEIFQLDGALTKEPCDRAKAEKLLELLLETGDNRAVITRGKAFHDKCGAHDKLTLLMARAHQNVSEWNEADVAFTQLVETEPYNSFYRAYRGRNHQMKGDVDAAISDFQQAYLLYPHAVDVPTELATLYEKQGKFCEAASALQQLAFLHKTQPFAAGLDERVRTLEQKGNCTGSADARAIIRMKPNESVLHAKVKVNGQEAAAFLVDTGASHVTLPRVLADRLGVRLSGAEEVVLRTANGRKTGHLVLLPSVAVEGVEARQVPAIVVDELSPGIEGLLGLSFLTRFDFRQADRVLELLPRGTKPAAPPSPPPSSP